ncbi:MAG: hypothetical protein LCH70_00695 [Proteobacteria bacterium]|nr:hypothetical protein [Pseudomonadota bacterium]
MSLLALLVRRGVRAGPVGEACAPAAGEAGQGGPQTAARSHDAEPPRVADLADAGDPADA